MKIHIYYVYILTNKHHNVLYVGVTDNLVKRVDQHKKKILKGFTSKYNVDKLVYYEVFDWIDTAIAREKQVKKYSRAKKVVLIEKMNPDWKELDPRNGKPIDGMD